MRGKFRCQFDLHLFFCSFACSVKTELQWSYFVWVSALQDMAFVVGCKSCTSSYNSTLFHAPSLLRQRKRWNTDNGRCATSLPAVQASFADFILFSVIVSAVASVSMYKQATVCCAIRVLSNIRCRCKLPSMSLLCQLVSLRICRSITVRDACMFIIVAPSTTFCRDKRCKFLIVGLLCASVLTRTQVH